MRINKDEEGLEKKFEKKNERNMRRHRRAGGGCKEQQASIFWFVRRSVDHRQQQQQQQQQRSSWKNGSTFTQSNDVKNSSQKKKGDRSSVFVRFFLSSICFLARTKVSTSTPETSSQCHSNVSNSVVNEWEICPIKICLYNQKVFLLQGSLECSICNYKNGRNGYSLKEKATSMSNDGQKERKESQ